MPVLLAGQRMLPADRLPVPLQWLASLHSAHIRTESADADIAALVDRLPPPTSRTEPSAARPPAPSGAGGIVGAWWRSPSWVRWP